MGFNRGRTEPTIIVPQNSLTQMRQKLGLMEYETLSGQRPNSFQNQAAKANTHCPHCENMAKNFLYLESLVRSNFGTDDQCCLCNATLKYLQYVNKNIAEVFGNFDSMVQASKAFTLQAKGNAKAQQASANAVAAKSRVNVEVKKPTEESTKKGKKQQQTKGKGKTVKMSTPPEAAKLQTVTVAKRMTGGSNASNGSALHVGVKHSKSRSKHLLRKSSAKKGLRTAALKRKERVSENGVFENGAKVLKKQSQPSKLKLKSSSRMLRSLKPRSIKTKQGKNKKSSLHVNK